MSSAVPSHKPEIGAPVVRWTFWKVAAMCAVAIVALGLSTLIVLSVQGARETARLNGCINNLRDWALAVSNHEAATQRYPLCSTSPQSLAATPGADDAGFSWMIMCLCFKESQPVSDEVSQKSEKFKKGPFYPTMHREDGSGFGELNLYAIRCPSYSGARRVDTNYASDYSGPLTDELAVSNYFCLPGTGRKVGVAPSFDEEDFDANGVITTYNGSPQRGKGCTHGDVGDGIANTLILCESREEHYANWYDGATSYVIPLRQLDSPRPTNYDGRTGFDPDSPEKTTINFQTAMPKSQFWGLSGAARDRRWGPSSEHEGNVAVHTFLDVSTRAIPASIDVTVYYRLITRNGFETPGGCDLSESLESIKSFR